MKPGNNKRLYTSLLTLVFCFASIYASTQNTIYYTDTSHYSTVFGHKKYYRLYLPDSYKSSDKKYAVIYFFHGWGGRHFKDDNALLSYEKIRIVVDRYQVILVMWDGNIDTTEPRPYNTGNHDNVKFNVQMKDYFPELFSHIDSCYRTVSNRAYRGIIGFSMGGFISFFLAGKYPDKVCAAASFAGSPEFFIGYPGNHTLYPVRYAFKNLSDVKTKLYNGDSDILYYLNDEVRAGAEWESYPLNYQKFHGGHMIDSTGETTRFETAIKFITDAFGSKKGPSPGWTHYDLYRDFSVWGYDVVTNKKTPGYTSLTHVDKNGFGLCSLRWLPDGPELPVDSISVITAPIYVPRKTYHIVHYHHATNELKTTDQQADADGKLHFFFTHTGIETGIYDDNDSASFVFLDNVSPQQYLRSTKQNKLSLRLFNRGGLNFLPATLNLSFETNDPGIICPAKKVKVTIKKGQRIISLPSLVLVSNKKPPAHAEPPQVKLNLTIQQGNKIFNDDFIIPVLYESPLPDSIQIDDRRVIRDSAMGTGNGDGIVNAGEQVLVYSGSNRLRLYSEDKWVLREDEKTIDEIIPARWPDGYTLSSLVKISPDCPDGHRIEFYASYETKTFNPIERKTNWGKLTITVVNKRK